MKVIKVKIGWERKIKDVEKKKKGKHENTRERVTRRR